MKDMLVKLYDLPKNCKELDELSNKISFRRPLAAEKSIRYLALPLMMLLI